MSPDDRILVSLQRRQAVQKRIIASGQEKKQMRSSECDRQHSYRPLYVGAYITHPEQPSLVEKEEMPAWRTHIRDVFDPLAG